MRFRRSDRSRKVRETKTRRSSVFFPSSFISEIASPERRRSLFIEPLEDRRVLSVVSVTPSDLQGWDVHNFYSTDGGNTYIDNGAVTPPSGTHGQFTASPASPYGAGSYQEIVGTDGNDASRIETSAVNGTLLSNLTTLNYSTNVTQYGSGGQAPYMKLRVDFDGNGTTDDTLIFEPVYQDGVYSFTVDGTTGGAPAPTPPSQGSLTLNTWQQWNVLTGGLWVNSANTGGPPLVTMAIYIAAHPGVKLATDRPALEMTSGFGAGSWDNFIGNFDNLTVGVSGVNTPYDFNVAGPVTIDMQALGYQDGSADTIKVQLDGSGTQLQVFINNSPTPAFTGAAADVTQLNILGSSDDDALTVDNMDGMISAPITFAGGLGFDSLIVTGDAGPNVSAVYNQTGSDATGFAGGIVYTGPVTATLDFPGLSPVESLTPLSLL